MHSTMKAAFRMFRRGKGGVFYWQDAQTGRQGTLGTKDKHTATQHLHQKNASREQPALNLALAKTYASAHDPKLASRTWQDVMNELSANGKEATRERCLRALAAKPFARIRNTPLIATTSEDLLSVVRLGGNATNHYMRRLHNLALNLGWLMCPVLVENGRCGTRLWNIVFFLRIPPPASSSLLPKLGGISTSDSGLRFHADL